MLWRFRRTKLFINSCSTSRVRRSNVSPLFYASPALRFFLKILVFLERFSATQLICEKPAPDLPYDYPNDKNEFQESVKNV